MVPLNHWRIQSTQPSMPAALHGAAGRMAPPLERRSGNADYGRTGVFPRNLYLALRLLHRLRGGAFIEVLNVCFTQ